MPFSSQKVLHISLKPKKEGHPSIRSEPGANFDFVNEDWESVFQMEQN
jgi:hypothetical protein